MFFVVAGHSVVDFDEAFFAHDSKFDPVFSDLTDDGDAVFLGVDSLVNLFARVDVSDVSVFYEVKLGGEPFDVAWHCGLVSHIKSILNNLRHLHRRLLLFHLSLLWRSLLFIRLLFLNPHFLLFISLKPLHRTNHFLIYFNLTQINLNFLLFDLLFFIRIIAM